MNQNNNIRNQRQQNINYQNMSQEELQKTQVLNLKDVEEAARYEKSISKKPAIIVAIIGALSIFFGTTFGVVQTLTSEPVSDNDLPTVQKRENTSQTDTLKCTYTIVNGTDGTDQIYNTIYTFENNALTKFVRTTSINPTPGSAIGPNAIENYKVAFQQYLVSIPGYEVVLTPAGTGIISTTTVDYTKLDLTTFPEKQQQTTYTIIDYVANTTKENVQADMLAKGYTCQ